MNEILARIVKRELEKIDKLSIADFMLTTEQLEALEALARIIKAQPPSDEPTGGSMNLEDALRAMAPKPLPVDLGNLSGDPTK